MTELYKNYLEVKKEHGDALVFYRVGDFYELFGPDAVTASGVLELTLTSRDVGEPERVPMCGVPYHCAEDYIRKLIERGYKTAMVEPTAEPLQAISAPAPVAQPEPANGRLNLTAKDASERILKDYLESIASDALAEKINNGVTVVKDGKTLVSKKDLKTFMTYACNEAQKQVDKGARYACIDHETVFNWLARYFEEDSIEGVLYNEDGTEYKPPKPVSKPSNKPVSPVTAPTVTKPKPQLSMFDMITHAVETVPEPAVNEPTELELEVSEDMTEALETDEPEVETAEESEDYSEYIPEDYSAVPVPSAVISEQSRLEKYGDLSGDPFDDPPVISAPLELKQDAAPELTPIGDNKFIDEDGVVYDNPPPVDADSESIMLVITSLLGGALIRREL